MPIIELKSGKGFKLRRYSLMMRIGILHSQYRSDIPSGENKTVDDIYKILSQNWSNIIE